MDYMEEYIKYWKTLGLADLLGTLFLIFNIVATLSSNMLFNSFVESKPSGRKTVLGKKLTLLLIVFRYNVMVKK